MNQKIYTLEKLDCAQCASVIESKVGKIKGVQNSSLNFINKKLKIELADNVDSSGINAVTDSIRSLVSALEPDVIVREEPVASKQTLAKQQTAKSTAKAKSQEEAKAFGRDIRRLIASGVLYGLAIAAREFTANQPLIFMLFLAALAVAGGKVILRACKNIGKGKVFDENFLMSIATIGAFLIGDYSEGVAVMIFYQVGELFQAYAVGKSRRSIASLMDIRPDYANLKKDGSFVKVSPEEVSIGDVILVKAGERVPLDGFVIEGASTLDTSALTGEALPRDVAKGQEVLSGCINQTGVLTVQVTKAFGDSTVSKILDMVENAGSKKSHSENFISKFARYYTPAVVIFAILLAILPPLFIQGQLFSTWVYRALVFLVISCPCALVISVPLGFFGGIGGASRLGILVKGSNYLEALAQTEVVVFDKTGTLTKGTFQVTQISPKGMTEEELLTTAAYAESYSNHPISLSLRQAFEATGKRLDPKIVEKIGQDDLEEIAGHGVKAKLGGKTVLAGNAKLMDQFNIRYEATDAVGTIVYLAIDNKYAGHIVIADQVKDDAQKAIAALKANNIKKTVMLTGDAKKPGEAVAAQLGLDQAYTELLPGDKVEQVEALLKETSPKGKLAFVGDGINDAPVLARADIGIAMGGLGSDAAIEAADIVIMTDEPSKLPTAIRLSKHTLRIVKQNIVLALGIKAVVLVLGAIGFASMWAAVFADVGVAFIAILNSMRALRVDAYRR